MMHRLINDTDFTKILNFLFTIKGIHKNDIPQLRLFIEAILYICRAGCQWRLLPCHYGSWRAIHKRFKYWESRNIWEKLLEFFQNNPDNEWVMIDSTVIRAHACAAGYGKNTQKEEALGRSKGGFSTKIHISVDALGNPLKFTLTPGQAHDITQAKFFIEDLFDSHVIADTAYDADHFIESIKAQQCKPVIPPRKNRIEPRYYDKHLYKERNIIERFIGKIKYFRRIFTRYDKSAKSFLSFLNFVGALIWLK